MYRFLLIPLVLLIGCQQEMPPSSNALTAPESEQIKADVRDSFEGMWAAVQRRDVEDMLNHFVSSESGSVMMNNLNLMQRSEFESLFRESWGEGLGEDAVVELPAEEEIEIVLVNREAALVFVRWPEREANEAEGIQGRGAYASMGAMALVEGEWKMHSAMQAFWQ